jgi:hypothetical protein
MSDQDAPHDPAARDGSDPEQAAPGGGAKRPDDDERRPDATEDIPGEYPKDDPDIEGEDRFDAG